MTLLLLFPLKSTLEGKIKNLTKKSAQLNSTLSWADSHIN